MALNSFEFWSFVIALCTVGLVYLLSDIVREAINEAEWDSHKFAWGDRQRRAPAPVAPWARHELLCAAVMLADIAIIKAIVSAYAN
jgi:hypothetical protein